MFSNFDKKFKLQITKAVCKGKIERDVEGRERDRRGERMERERRGRERKRERRGRERGRGQRRERKCVCVIERFGMKCF